MTAANPKASKWVAAFIGEATPLTEALSPK